MPRNLLLALACSLAVATMAQPTWRFPIAFEDGTGARDTIWLAYDTTATTGWAEPQVDTALGEGAIHMDLNVFNVWVYNWDNDSTKTVAFPYTVFPYHNATIYAFNYQYPVTMRWDMSLGSIPWLPQTNWPIDAGMIYNDYFYFHNNCGGPPCGFFDMRFADSVVVVDAFPAEAFPADFTLGHDLHIGIAKPHGTSDINVWPNPVQDRIHVTGLVGTTTATIYSLLGVRLLTAILSHGDNTLDLDDLLDGSYLLTLTNPHGNERFKFIKVH